MKDTFKKIEKITKNYLKKSSHDWDHTKRVYNLAMHLAKEEDVDFDILKAAIFLHDIARVKEDQSKNEFDHAEESAKIAKKILTDVGFPNKKIKKVLECIRSHRFRSDNIPKTKEAQILFDADKLDGIGAIGIARTFLLAGEHNSKLYEDEQFIEEYKRKNIGKNGKIKDISLHSPYYEFILKLKNVKGKLITNKAKEIAKERDLFMRKFFNEFKKEWKGIK